MDPPKAVLIIYFHFGGSLADICMFHSGYQIAYLYIALDRITLVLTFELYLLLQPMSGGDGEGSRDSPVWGRGRGGGLAEGGTPLPFQG